VRTMPAVIILLAFALVTVSAVPAMGQSAPQWRVGAGFLYSRPGGQLWGVNLQREQRLTGPVVYRAVGSVDVLGSGDLLDPLLVTLGGDVGLRARPAPLTALIAIGPTLAYFQAPRRLYDVCQGGTCTTRQRGYEPGFVLAATGSVALGLQVSSELQLFVESRMHVPSGIGRSGYAGDPHAAFVELAFGVTLLR